MKLSNATLRDLPDPILRPAAARAAVWLAAQHKRAGTAGKSNR